MNRLDFTPYRRSTVGFDRLFDLLESQVRNSAGDNYPPFNIERRGEDSYRITLAVAGFREEDLDITAHQNLLVIQGRKREDSPEGEMLHVGIANRGFERRFELADFVRVERADLADGLLPEIIERPDHPWFVGVQFHPELKSKPFDPHPLFASFIEAAVKQSRLM